MLVADSRVNQQQNEQHTLVYCHGLGETYFVNWGERDVFSPEEATAAIPVAIQEEEAIHSTVELPWPKQRYCTYHTGPLQSGI